MTRKNRWVRGGVGLALWAIAECAAVAAMTFAVTTPATAQFFEPRYPNLSRQRPSRGGFFEQLFGPNNSRQDEMDDREDSGRNRTRSRSPEREQAPTDFSRAPSPRKPDKDAAAPATSVVVMGDAMADWLAYGLEDAFADVPEVGIVRKVKTYSGLIRYDAKSDLDWWHAARDILGGEKPSYVVMMIGLADRTAIREKDVAKEAEKKKEEAGKEPAKDAKDTKDAAKPAPNGAVAENKDEEDDEAGPAAPEPAQAKRSNGVLEFRSGPWEKVYSHRIDETIAALKSKGVPVFWVGLPSIRGSRSTADAVYLNDLYRGRAEKAGVVYIDVWDGFVDEGGKYTTYGPDYEGQMRRLRTNDGVYFTKYGARKLAHYVEREIRRYMSNRSLQVSLPSGPMGPVPTETAPAARPLAGPVVPLTAATGNTDELLGGGGAAMARGDAIATGVLVKGDPVTAPAGRADSFIWPPGSTRPVASARPATVAVPEPVAVKPEPVAISAPADVTPPPIRNSQPAMAAPAEPKKNETAKTEVKPERKPVARREQKPRHAVDNRQRPPAPVGQRAQQPPQRRSGGGLFDSNGPFGWIR